MPALVIVLVLVLVLVIIIVTVTVTVVVVVCFRYIITVVGRALPSSTTMLFHPLAIVSCSPQVKPANLMMDAKGYLKLTGFGHAGRNHTHRPGQEFRVSLRGKTPGFESPEVSDGEVNVSTFAYCETDLWAWGCTAIAILERKDCGPGPMATSIIQNKPDLPEKEWNWDKIKLWAGGLGEGGKSITNVLQEKDLCDGAALLELQPKW